MVSVPCLSGNPRYRLSIVATPSDRSMREVAKRLCAIKRHGSHTSVISWIDRLYSHAGRSEWNLLKLNVSGADEDLSVPSCETTIRTKCGSTSGVAHRQNREELLISICKSNELLNADVFRTVQAVVAESELQGQNGHTRRPTV
jgi:hypothetical protein